MEISAAVGFENVKVFAADPWWEAQPGSIKNLKINVKGNKIYYKGTLRNQELISNSPCPLDCPMLPIFDKN